MTDIEIPLSACRIHLAEDALEVHEPQAEGKKPRFRMRVNSGIPMSHPYFNKLAVQLSGIEWSSKHIPALLDHDTTRRVGYTTKLYVDPEEGLVAEGILLSNEDAVRLRQDSQDGFPWQASCYLQASDVTQLEEGEQLDVNGHEVVGPAFVFNEASLREVTFCALGQDPNTSSDATLNDGVSTVRAKLSVIKSSTMNDIEEPTTPIPASVVDVESVRLEAQQAESDRVGYILELAADAQMSLARKLIKDGVTERESALSLSQDMRDRDAQAAPVLSASPATQPLSSTDATLTATDSFSDDEHGWKAKWQSDAALRSEFDGNENIWLAFNKNKHLCRSYGTHNEEIK